jgi:transcriptional regulator GlxA family with amidase domain
MHLDENLYVRSPLEKAETKANHIVRIGIVALNGANALDFMGPIDTFSQANKAQDASLSYKVDLIGVRAGPIVTSSGVRMLPDRIIGPHLEKYDTILIAGSQDVQKTTRDEMLSDWLVASAATARRIGSICSGAFALAAAGLLDGRRVAIQGGYAKQLTPCFPAFVRNPINCSFEMVLSTARREAPPASICVFISSKMIAVRPCRWMSREHC